MLKKRFAYMFTGLIISLEFYKDWFSILVCLCTEIDRMLGENRHSFRWVQFKEKLGVMRLHPYLKSALEPLGKALQELLFMVTVCPVHEPGQGGKPPGWLH